jgi:outer membrane protein OmpA-like peptidoglycan-associated protein
MPFSTGSVSQLVANIRGQLVAAGLKPALPAVGNSRPDSSNPADTSPYNAQNINALIRQRIEQIDKDAPNRGKKAFRVFLEAVLLTQLGEQQINDPKFYQLLDDVQAAIENNPQTRVLVDQATAHLLG